MAPDERDGDAAGRARMAPPEYRPTREHDAADPAIRKLAVAALCIAVVAMGGVWAFSTHHHAGVPVIEPDSRPLRVKPTNPGGMQADATDDALPSDASGAENDKLAPPPETPAPQVLQQQEAAAAAPPTLPATSLPTASPPPAAPAPPADTAAATPLPPPETPLPLPQALPTPAPPTPAPPPAAAPPAPAPLAAPPPPAPSGHVQVQLAALDTEAAAQVEWQRLQRSAGDLLSGRAPSILRVDRDGRVFYRLRTGGFSSIAEATAFCARIRATGGGCAIASF